MDDGEGEIDLVSKAIKIPIKKKKKDKSEGNMQKKVF